MKEGNELCKWDWKFSVVHCISYQMISADKLVDQAM